MARLQSAKVTQVLDSWIAAPPNLVAQIAYIACVLVGGRVVVVALEAASTPHPASTPAHVSAATSPLTLTTPFRRMTSSFPSNAWRWRKSQQFKSCVSGLRHVQHKLSVFRE